ncbi:hypothetical protein K3495_g889 [Podosphaera aphanis]|nr:hypothetical protein K3495_g889 [Podosphaera aphanis]
MDAPNTRHILCFGDSLTAGFTRWGVDDHPYGLALTSCLEKKFPQLHFVIDVQGLGGDRVISPPGRFLPRMRELYQKRHVEMPYDFAVILGGTNDVGVKSLARDIFPALEGVWAIPLSAGTKVLALTVPEFGYNCSERSAEREALNASIRSYETENFHVFDLSKAVPHCNISEEERKLLWQDPIHFTERGYDRVGTLVAEQLAEIITATYNRKSNNLTKDG